MTMSTSTSVTATHTLLIPHHTIKRRRRPRTRTPMPKKTGKSYFIFLPPNRNTLCAACVMAFSPCVSSWHHGRSGQCSVGVLLQSQDQTAAALEEEPPQKRLGIRNGILRRKKSISYQMLATLVESAEVATQSSIGKRGTRRGMTQLGLAGVQRESDLELLVSIATSALWAPRWPRLAHGHPAIRRHLKYCTLQPAEHMVSGAVKTCRQPKRRRTGVKAGSRTT